MKKQLTSTVKHFADTILEAEALVLEAKNTPGANVKQHSISKKEKTTKEEYIEYYVVKITLENDTIKNIIG